MSIKSLLTDKERKALNQAVQSELYASHFYLYAASCTQKHGLFGAQAFFEQEAAQEIDHYKRLRDVMNDFGDEAEMPMIEEVEFESEELMGILQDAYDMELDLLRLYEKIWDESSVSVKQAVLWFVEKQRESVGEYGDLISRLSIASGKEGVILFDEYLKG